MCTQLGVTGWAPAAVPSVGVEAGHSGFSPRVRLGEGLVASMSPQDDLPHEGHLRVSLDKGGGACDGLREPG